MPVTTAPETYNYAAVVTAITAVLARAMPSDHVALEMAVSTVHGLTVALACIQAGLVDVTTHERQILRAAFRRYMRDGRL